MNYPEISIILYIDDYNLNTKKAINSILFQTAKEFELIIVSYNNKWIHDLLLMFNDKRIRHIIVKNRKKLLVYEGIKNARGNYISFASPNNSYLEDRLKRQIAYMAKNAEIGISGVCSTSYISDMELIKVLHLQGPVLHWPSIIIKRDIFHEYEFVFKKREHISVICYQLAVSILCNNTNVLRIFNERIYLYNIESYFEPVSYNQISIGQVRSMGIKINRSTRLHAELFNYSTQNNFPYQEYQKWVKIIEKHNKGYYNSNLLSGLLNSFLCLKTKNTIDSGLSKGTSDAIRILVVTPHLGETNPFISILIKEINSDKYIVKYGVHAFWNLTENYDIIHIHWPEMLFNWRPLIDNDIKTLTVFINKWKQKGAKFVYTRHDENTHYSINKLITHEIFDLIKRESDAIIHMGEYSKRETIKELIIPRQINTVIPHHIYDTIYSNSIDKETAREVLDIDKTGIVILVFGDFRDKEENFLVKEAFERLEVDNKFLLAPSWKNKEIAVSGNVFLGDSTVDEDMLPFCFAAADIVFIQRVKVLNSGNLPMAFFFNKVVVGPNIGNVREYLDEKNNFSFDCNDISTASKALYKAVVRIKNGVAINNEMFAKDKWRTALIVEKYKSVYQTLYKK